MDTINISANGHIALFSKKSVTIDGKEFLYSEISSVKHSSAKCVYLFKYEGNMQPLFYNESETKIVAALFKKILALNASKATATPPAKAQVAVEGATVAEDAITKEIPAETATKETPVAEAKPDAEATVEDGTADTDATVDAETAVEDGTAGAEATADAKTTVEDGTADAEATVEDGTADADATAHELDKKNRLKKALIIFAIIIVVFIGAGIAYFFFIGPSNDASNNETVDGTHQYNDIEEMIEEMQN